MPSQLAKAKPDRQAALGPNWEVATIRDFRNTLGEVAPYIAGLLPGP
jgi:hypothetical protein